MAPTITTWDFVLVAASVGGVSTFFRGFRLYRKFLLLQGASEIPIRSMAMGLVRVHGKASSDHLVTSPVTHSLCCIYQVHIEKWRDGDDEDSHQSWAWQHYGSEAAGAPFYLEDSTGRVLVDPRGAEYILESTATREASSAQPSSVVANGASEVDLLSYVARVGPSPEAPWTRHDFESERGIFEMAKYATIAKYARQGEPPRMTSCGDYSRRFWKVRPGWSKPSKPKVHSPIPWTRSYGSPRSTSISIPFGVRNTRRDRSALPNCRRGSGGSDPGLSPPRLACLLGLSCLPRHRRLPRQRKKSWRRSTPSRQPPGGTA